MSICPANDQEIRYQISQIRDLPPLPQSVQRLIDIIQNEVESSDELESIIGYEQAVAAKVLQAANSSYYGYRKKVDNISKAIVLIGCNQTKSICLCTLLMNLFNGRHIEPAYRERLWKHALTTSKVASEISRSRPWVQKQEAALMGLLHDVGHLVMASYYGDQFQFIMDLASKRKSPPWCVEMELGFVHTEIGKYLASRWAFPDSFQAVIEFHHSPQRCDSFRSEVRLIYLADVIANSPYYPEFLTDEATLKYCRDLYISEDEWQEYCNRFALIVPEVDQLWNLMK